jgi:hypothetical protein
MTSKDSKDRKRLADDDDDDDDDDSREDRKHKKDHKRRRRDDPSDDVNSEAGNEDDSTRRHRKRSRKHDKKKKKSKRKSRRDYSSDSESYDSDSTESSYERRRRKKKKRKKKDRKHSKSKSRQRDEESDSESNNKDDGIPTFGKYGVLKPTDMNRMQRSFEIWMSEVKGISAFNGPKWELQQYFEEYREDFNTATLPHQKYYDYDKWELQEYQKEKQKQQGSSNSMVLADEAQHRQKMQLRQKEHERKAVDLVKSTMSKTKILEMKRQQELRAEMQVAFKMGDKKKYERLKERLAADE